MLRGAARLGLPLGLVFDFVAKWSKKWFCEIVDDPWWFLDEFWLVLISFSLIFKRPPVLVVLLAFVFSVFCKGFEEPAETTLSAFRLVLRYRSETHGRPK